MKVDFSGTLSECSALIPTLRKVGIYSATHGKPTLVFKKIWNLFCPPTAISNPPPPKRAGGGALRPSNDTKVLSSSSQRLSERCWIAFQPVNHATPSGSRALRSPPQHPLGPGGRALITLRQVYLESAPEKEQRRKDDRFFTGGTFLFLARGHSGRTTNMYKKKHSRLKEKKKCVFGASGAHAWQVANTSDVGVLTAVSEPDIWQHVAECELFKQPLGGKTNLPAVDSLSDSLHSLCVRAAWLFLTRIIRVAVNKHTRLGWRNFFCNVFISI